MFGICLTILGWRVTMCVFYHGQFVFALLLAEPHQDVLEDVAPCYADVIDRPQPNQPEHEMESFVSISGQFDFPSASAVLTFVCFSSFVFLTHSTSPGSGRVIGCEYAMCVSVYMWLMLDIPTSELD